MGMRRKKGCINDEAPRTESPWRLWCTGGNYEYGWSGSYGPTNVGHGRECSDFAYERRVALWVLGTADLPVANLETRRVTREIRSVELSMSGLHPSHERGRLLVVAVDATRDEESRMQSGERLEGLVTVTVEAEILPLDEPGGNESSTNLVTRAARCL